MRQLWFVLKRVGQGQSVTRAYLDYRLRDETLRGQTIDIGGGHGAAYLSFMPRTDDTVFETFDTKRDGNQVDFETDALPGTTAGYDTVLCLNVLEHIYNHQHLATELVRLTKPTGQLIGFVPFLMWYHADPHDYFRYTHEALTRILTTAGAKRETITIEAIGGGPFVAAAQMIMQSIPVRFIRPFVFLFLYLLDQLYTLLKRRQGRTYALGYVFVIRPSATLER